jgi:hypothetical protein
MLNREHQAGTLVRLHLLAAYILQVLHHEMGTTLFNLLARMARAHRNDYGAGRDASLNAARRVFKDDTTRGLVAEALGGKEERVRRGFARAEAWVVRRDRHFWRDNAHACKAAMRCSHIFARQSRCDRNCRDRGGE